MLELRFASTEQQKSLLTSSRLLGLALGVWTTLATLAELAEESLTQASVQTPSHRHG